MERQSISLFIPPASLPSSSSGPHALAACFPCHLPRLAQFWAEYAVTSESEFHLNGPSMLKSSNQSKSTSGTLSKLRGMLTGSGKGSGGARKVRKMTEKDIDEALVLIRRSLLEADVNFRVARDFVAAIPLPR